MSHSKPSASTKRKIEDEKRIFQSKWKILCPEKIKDLNNISLSRNIVAERDNDIATDLRSQLTKTCKDVQAFSIAIDESTDVNAVAQLCVFIRGCNFKYEITKELLELILMHGTTTDAEIILEIEKLLGKYKLPITKLVSMVIDGTPAMIGSKKGFVGKLNEKIGKKINNFHCIIHQEVLCGKTVDLDYTQVRWLSCHRVLKAFNHLNTEIFQFLETKGQDISDIKNTMFLQDLAFLVDITKHLNDLNIILQGKNKLVTTILHIKKMSDFKWELDNLITLLLMKTAVIHDEVYAMRMLMENANSCPIENCNEYNVCERCKRSYDHIRR
ncbi:general transcription factor II-I repeat domain-containing protein 2-like [Hydra vulgaris]|uniref:General transcription factor II-I repeat domain-containing protein 2-like n=1 Tax=Hydra vulgaris TaxID=6087 RepID=A0ABM4CA66_HYDVU